MKINEVMLLAGGLGTRLKTCNRDLPKPLAPINGKSFLSMLVQFWLKPGIKRIIICSVINQI